MSEVVSPELWADEADENGVVRGFMCMVDWQHHAGADARGNMVYWSEKNIKERRKCVSACGIVEVQIKAIRVVSPQNLFGKRDA